MQDTEKFYYRYVTGWGFAKASNEIMAQIKQWTDIAKSLIEKKKGKNIKNFKIGGDNRANKVNKHKK